MRGGCFLIASMTAGSLIVYVLLFLRDFSISGLTFFLYWSPISAIRCLLHSSTSCLSFEYMVGCLFADACVFGRKFDSYRDAVYPLLCDGSRNKGAAPLGVTFLPYLLKKPLELCCVIFVS